MIDDENKGPIVTTGNGVHGPHRHLQSLALTSISEEN